jgi:pyruvate dehydrogenase phosphatase
MRFRFSKPLFGWGASLFCETRQDEKNTKKASVSVGSYQYPANSPIEDRIISKPLAPSVNLYGVFDGHGGWQVSEYCMKTVPKKFNELFLDTNTIEDSIRKVFLSTDADIKAQIEKAYDFGFSKSARVGSCGLVSIVTESKIFIGNVGDSKSTIIRKGKKYQVLTTDQSADNPIERNRLVKEHPDEPDIFKCKKEWTEKVGGGLFTASEEIRKYSICYVKGVLQPTRAFGDFHLKYERLSFDKDRNKGFLNDGYKKSFPYITADPEITVIDRRPDDQFLVLATDGLWDELSDEEVTEIVEAQIAAGSDCQKISTVLVEEALKKAAIKSNLPIEMMCNLPQGPRRRSIHDDISVIVVDLRNR